MSVAIEPFHSSNREIFCTECDLHEYQVGDNLGNGLQQKASEHVQETGHTVRSIARFIYEWKISKESSEAVPED